MAVTKVRSGASWVEGVWKTYSGGAWKDNAKMRISSVWEQINQLLSIDTSVITSNSQVRFGATCTSYVKLDSDGDYYESGNTGIFGSSEGTYLTSGLNSEVWVSYALDSGSSLSVGGSAGTRFALTSDRTFGNTQSSSGTRSSTITFSFHDAATGGNVIATKQITISAQYA